MQKAKRRGCAPFLRKGAAPVKTGAKNRAAGGIFSAALYQTFCAPIEKFASVKTQ